MIKVVFIVKDAVNGGLPSRGQSKHFCIRPEVPGSNSSSVSSEVLSRTDYHLHRKTEACRAVVLLDLDGLQCFQKRTAFIPRHLPASRNHVITFQGAHGNELDFM